MMFLLAAGCEQKPVRFLAGHPDVVVYRLAGMFRQFKPDRTPGLSLAHGRPVGTIAIRSNVLDLESDEITPTQLTVDG